MYLLALIRQYSEPIPDYEDKDEIFLKKGN